MKFSRVFIKKTVYSLAGGILILTGLLFFLFVNNMKNHNDSGTASDAIVVLTGGLGRIEKGVNLFLQRRSQYLILSGVNKESDLKSIFFQIKSDIDVSRILLDNNSTNTYENAVETANIIKKKGLKSITLVTSRYHMKRAAYTFKKILPPNVAIYIHPVSTPNFDDKNWWRHATSIGIVVMEFLKFYWYKLWI